jgi:hypothetical protein
VVSSVSITETHQRDHINFQLCLRSAARTGYRTLDLVISRYKLFYVLLFHRASCTASSHFLCVCMKKASDLSMDGQGLPGCSDLDSFFPFLAFLRRFRHRRCRERTSPLASTIGRQLVGRPSQTKWWVVTCFCTKLFNYRLIWNFCSHLFTWAVASSLLRVQPIRTHFYHVLVLLIECSSGRSLRPSLFLFWIDELVIVCCFVCILWVLEYALYSYK